MTNTTNPAGRLINILEKFSSQSDPLKIIPARDAWKDILEIESDDDSDLFHAILAVNELVRDTKEVIGRVATNGELYLRNFDAIEKAVFPGDLDSDFAYTAKLVNETVLQSLHFCSDLLSTYYDEGELTKEELSHISNMVDELFETTFNTDLEPNVKTFILESLEAIRRSINYYKIYGAKGLRSAFQLSLGGIVANQEQLSSTKEKNPAFMKSIASLLSKVDSATAMAFKAQKVLSKALPLLGLDEDK
ncbi:hypothetical protein J7384_12925 [Endozoicomonas sp. G2_1]|uniref:hypothetical protein n=1 Tax=Endozoicomonas sp. G2_1 TaxID=2821091 RepID=UPI001ADD558B|nr:hypothetical protein [Endozoicomonas sp. G2_1]MBO9491268.1 hypothetical protein [Endozoicomonas sp. G2_1]